MRAIAILFGLVVLSLAWATSAQANGGVHGGYTATADGCAGCHRAHTATAPGLLTNTNTALCLTCHGTAATGADTNVADGVLDSTQAGLNGGGFTHAKQDTSLSGTASSGPVTSLHQVQGMPGYNATATMWGAGDVVAAAPGSAGTAFDLYCTSCHDPHGSPNYRILRTTVNGTAVTVSPTDEASKSYTTPTYNAGSGQWQISSFCGACHTRYLATASGSGENASGDFIFSYRHRIDAPSGATVNGQTYTFPTTGLALPVSSTNGAAPTASPDNRAMVCLTCHYSHGTKAVMGSGPDNRSGSVPWPSGAAGPTGDARSSLLRLDFRGVCQNCHQK